MTYQEALSVVLGAVGRDPALYPNLLSKLDRDQLKRFVNPAIAYPQKLPLGANRIEAAIFDNGESKAKRKRLDQERTRWNMRLKLCMNRSDFKEPEWSGEALLRTPERALAFLPTLTKPTRCLTPLRDDQVEWLRRAVEGAKAQDMLVGFLYQKPSTQGGTYYLENHVVLVPNTLETTQCDMAWLVFKVGQEEHAITLPEFATTRSDGKAFGGRVILQSRGTRATHRYSEWKTGEFTLT